MNEAIKEKLVICQMCTCKEQVEWWFQTGEDMVYAAIKHQHGHRTKIQGDTLTLYKIQLYQVNKAMNKGVRVLKMWICK